MKNIRQSGMAALLLALLSVTATAQAPRVFHDGRGWVEESSGTLSGAQGLVLKSAMGSVTVLGAEQSNITYAVRKRVLRGGEEAARRNFQAFTVNAYSKGGSAYVIGEWSGGSEGRMTVEYQVKVPRQFEWAKVVTHGGSITLKNITGKAALQTAGGFITMDQIGGPVNASTQGGSIELGSAGSDVVLKTAGGSITIGSVLGTVRATSFGGSIQIGSGKQWIIADTAGGSITVRESGGELKATTAGGNLEIGSVNGPAYLTTAGGSIRLDSAQGLVRASTAGGGIRLRGLNAGASAKTAAGAIQAEFIGPANSFKDSYLETTVGDIFVALPENMAVTVRAAIEMAQGHNIRSEFSGLKVNSEGGSYGPKEVYCEGSLNGGGPLLKVHATTGNIEFRRVRR